MRVEQSPSAFNQQEIAFIFASRILEAKRNKKAAKMLSREVPQWKKRREIKKQAIAYLKDDIQQTLLSQGQQIKLNEIKENLTVRDQAYLENKRNNFTQMDKVRLVFQAKSKLLSGLSAEERYNMQKEAGHSEEEINTITGKKILLAAGIAQGLEIIAQAGRGYGTVNENIFPFVEKIPDNYTTPVVMGSMALYTISYALFIEKNMQLTKKYGTSASPTVTGLYFISDKLFPNNVRDNLTRGIPIFEESMLYNVIYPLTVENVTGEPNKIITGSLIGAGLNLLYLAGCEIWYRKMQANSRKAGSPD